MPHKAKMLIAAVLCLAVFLLVQTAAGAHGRWWAFSLCLAAVLLTSGMKVPRPSGSGSMSLNYPFIFLAIALVSPFEACLVAAISVAVQCRIGANRWLAAVQISFNVANSICSTAGASLCFGMLVGKGLAVAPALAIAGVAYFVCNTIPVALVIGWSSKTEPFSLWRREFHWYLPFYLIGAILAAGTRMIAVRFGWSTAVLILPVVYAVYRSYAAKVAQMEERRTHLEETEALHLRTIEGLAMAIEAKDENTHEHLFRVRDYVTDIAGVMGLDELQKKALQTAAFLHDIGKLAVPEHIINKPGKLTPEEFEKMKIHPVVGADILERVRFPYPVVPIVRSHHERWDGKGYPDGLEGEAIPIGARVLSVVDCFDALASDRPYRRAMPMSKAMEIVKSMSGTQFDPAIVEVLESRYLALERSFQAQQEKFVPLNLSVDVHRGAAPAAGFEQGHAARTGAGMEDAAREPIAAAENLRRIAAVKEAAQDVFDRSSAEPGALRVDDIGALLGARLRSTIPFDCCALYRKDGDTVRARYLDRAYAHRFKAEAIRMGEGISGWVAENGLPILNGNATVEPTYVASAAIGSGSYGIGGDAMELRSALSIPLFDLEGNVDGVLTLYAASSEPFTQEHLRMLQATELKLSLALQNVWPLEVMMGDQVMGSTVPLLGGGEFLASLHAELERSRHSGGQIAVVVCGRVEVESPDGQAGWRSAEVLVSRFGEQLAEFCGCEHTAAQIGTQEFALLLTGAADALPVGEREWLAGAVHFASDAAGLRTGVLSSIGTAVYPSDGDAADTLLTMAERRMHRCARESSRKMQVASSASEISAAHASTPSRVAA